MVLSSTWNAIETVIFGHVFVAIYFSARLYVHGLCSHDMQLALHKSEETNELKMGEMLECRLFLKLLVATWKTTHGKDLGARRCIP